MTGSDLGTELGALPVMLASNIAGSNVVLWFRDHGLPAALYVLGAILVSRLVRVTFRRAGEAMDNRRGRVDVSEEERAKHLRSVFQATSWTLSVVVYVVAAWFALGAAGVSRGFFLVAASVAGTAIGFGAKQVVGDVLSGFFIVTEAQYGVGDVIRVSKTGDTGGVSGSVEAVTLRTTRLRTLAGEAITMANGEIRQVANLSKGWSRLVVDIPLAPDQDIKEAEFVLERILHQVWRADEWTPLMLEEPTIRGIDTIEVGKTVIQVIVKTLPGKQWDVGREIRRRVSVAFHGAGIKLARPIGMPRRNK